MRSASHQLASPRRQARLLRRWAQAGDIWRQLLRQWMLLEPLLLQCSAPLLVSPAQPLLLQRLNALQGRLQVDGGAVQALRPSEPALAWIAEADRLRAPRPLLLALAVQCQELEKLLISRALVRGGIERLLAAQP